MNWTMYEAIAKKPAMVKVIIKALTAFPEDELCTDSISPL